MFGVSYFKSRTVILSGACHPLGQSLALRLAHLSATIVALDTNAEALRALAARAPARIETLTLALETRDAQDILRSAWETEPIHLCIDVTALRGGQVQKCPDRGARITGLSNALQSGLASGAARGVVVLPDPAPGDPPEEHAAAAALGALVARLPGYAPPARVTALAVNDAVDAWTPSHTLSIGDLVLMLGHPVSRGLMPFQTLRSDL